MYPLFTQYILQATDGEMIEFFQAFTEEERNGEFRDLFYGINESVKQAFPDPKIWVEKYFIYRGLITQAMDMSVAKEQLDKIIAANEKAWKEYCGGKDAAVGRFIGLLSKATGIDPKIAKTYIETRKTS